VHAGAGVELQLEDGHWIGGRYESSWLANEKGRTLVPMFHFGLGGGAGVAIRIPDSAVLRWAGRE
jgi:hypothetical protein